jgi:3-dehydroquinate dehydratase-1
MNPAKAIDIRGRRLGGETPLICSPLVGWTRERVLAEAAAVVAKKPDVIEWRVDYFEGIGDTAAVLDTAKASRGGRGHADHFHAALEQGGQPTAIDGEGVPPL